MIDAQLFGIVAEEKEAGAFAGTREAKKLRAYDTYQLLAQGITFKANLATMLSLVSCNTPTLALCPALNKNQNKWEGVHIEMALVNHTVASGVESQ